MPGIQFKSSPSLFSSWNRSNADQEKVSSNLKVVYLATYYSLTTQCNVLKCNAAYVANGWCNAAEIDGIEDKI